MSIESLATLLLTACFIFNGVCECYAFAKAHKPKLGKRVCLPQRLQTDEKKYDLLHQRFLSFVFSNQIDNYRY